jgi:hypothetical protein
MSANYKTSSIPTLYGEQLVLRVIRDICLHPITVDILVTSSINCRAPSPIRTDGCNELQSFAFDHSTIGAFLFIF